MQENEPQFDFSFKTLFVPLTSAKAIHWIIFIGFIVYANMLFNNFLWDDIAYIVNNSQIHLLTYQTILNSFKISLFNSGGEYRPLIALYFMVMYSVFGNITFFYHIFQLCIHITNAILAFILLKRFFSNKISLFLSLVFMIHPAQTEAVTYIASVANPLYFLFGISALLLSFKSTITIRRFFIILFLLLLSALSKETGLLFVFLILFYRLLFHKKGIAIFIISSVITIAIYLFFRVVIGDVFLTKLALASIANLSLAGRLINIPEIFLYYIKIFFLPITLSVDQEWVIQNISFSTFYFPLIIDLVFVILICFVGWQIFKKQKAQYRPYLFFVFWFVLGISLNLQIFPLDFTVSDRWLYFPIVGLLGILAFVYQLLCGYKKHLQRYAYGIAVVILIMLAVRTMIRNTNWQNQLTLFSHDIAFQDNFDSENNLGSAYSEAGDPKQALIHYTKSVLLLPSDTNLFNLGYTYEQLGDLKDAKIYYQKVIDDTSSHSTLKNFSFQALGFLYLNHNPTIAKHYALTGLQVYPNDGSLYSILAISEYDLHDRTNAIKAAENAKKFLPDQETNSLYLLILRNKPLNISGNKSFD